MWGQNGDGDGDLRGSYGVAVDADGNVYVADTHNHRIQKFDSGGTFQVMWGRGVSDGSGGFQVCIASCERGQWGSGDGEFSFPRGVAVDTDGDVFVADAHNNRIQKFKPDGVGYSYDTQWGEYGTGSGQFNYPFGVNTNASGNIYVADAYNNRIQKFDSGGNFLYQWGELGAVNGQFDAPYGVASDKEGNVYVADTSNHRIQKFGELPVFPPLPEPPPPPSPLPVTPTTVSETKKLDSDAYKKACNLRISSPKIKADKSPSVEISAKRKRLSLKKARRIFTKGLKGHISWGKVNGEKVVCKKVKMVILEKRGKRHYVPGTRIRVSKKRLGVTSFYKKVVRFLRGKKVGKLKQKRIKGKRRTNILYKEFRSLKLKKKALKRLSKRRYRGKFVVIYTAEVDGVTVKKTVVL